MMPLHYPARAPTGGALADHIDCLQTARLGTLFA
jgi:hypothetical protein